MNILFGPEKKKRVDPKEFEETMRKAAAILDEQEEREVHIATRSAFDVESNQPVGMSADEMEHSMKALEEHGSLEEHELEYLRGHLEEHLKD